VIMPNYNKSKFIASAIESVLSQTMPDLELLVVDDASTDDSAGIVENLSLKDTRVSLLRQATRKGVSHCRNVGIRESRASTVAFLDSDDLYAPSSIELMYRAMSESRSPVIVYSNCWLLDGNGRTLPPWTYRSCTSSGMIFTEFLLDGMHAQANLMLPKKLFDIVGLYDESLKWGEDTDMIFRLASRYPFVYVDQPLYGYRLHPGNTLSGMSAQMKLVSKTPIVERHYRANIRMLDSRTRRVVSRRLVVNYLEVRKYRRALANALSSPEMLSWFLRYLGRKALRRDPHS
jgi:glycosyltransferase involved in cell wall biosynthesis